MTGDRHATPMIPSRATSITFGGVLASYNLTATVDADGVFQLTVELDWAANGHGHGADHRPARRPFQPGAGLGHCVNQAAGRRSWQLGRCGRRKVAAQGPSPFGTRLRHCIDCSVAVTAKLVQCCRLIAHLDVGCPHCVSEASAEHEVPRCPDSPGSESSLARPPASAWWSCWSSSRSSAS